MQSFKLKILGVTILQGVEFPIFLLIFEWALQQCSATALHVPTNTIDVDFRRFCPYEKVTVCTVVQNCCKGRSKKYRKWHFSGYCRRETP